jgi:hypothetical protein
MALIKYSIGPITSVEDKDSVEKREDSISTATEKAILVLCKKCGIQHMVSTGEARVCCGNSVDADKLS